MITLDLLARTFLLIGQEWFIMLFLVIGFWGIKRNVFGPLLLALMASLVINKFLKHYFQIPLPPAVVPNLDKAAYGFPSGHTQSVALLLSWLVLEWRQRWFTILAVLWLIGYMWGIVHAGYHYPADPLAGTVVGLWWCLTCRWLFSRTWAQDRLPWVGILLALAVTPLLFFVPWTPTVGYIIGMIVFSFGWGIGQRRCVSIDEKLTSRAIALVSVLCAVFLCYFYIKNALPLVLPASWVFIGWYALLALVMSTSGWLFRKA